MSAFFIEPSLRKQLIKLNGLLCLIFFFQFLKLLCILAVDEKFESSLHFLRCFSLQKINFKSKETNCGRERNWLAKCNGFHIRVSSCWTPCRSSILLSPLHSSVAETRRISEICDSFVKGILLKSKSFRNSAAHNVRKASSKTSTTQRSQVFKLRRQRREWTSASMKSTRCCANQFLQRATEADHPPGIGEASTTSLPSCELLQS